MEAYILRKALVMHVASLPQGVIIKSGILEVYRLRELRSS